MGQASEWRPGADGEVCGAESPSGDHYCTLRLDHDGEHQTLLAAWPNGQPCCNETDGPLQGSDERRSDE